MLRITTVLLFVSVIQTAKADEIIVTREKLFAPLASASLSPERRYADIDLNGDGTNDLVLSESVSLGGTGGLVHNLYLGLGGDRFRFIDRFLAGILSLESSGETPRLWSYSHMSSRSGTIQYRCYDHKGVFQISPGIAICPGDGGTEVGNGIYKAIFNEKTMLKMKTTGTSNLSS